jgi:hypothetical protein
VHCVHFSVLTIQYLVLSDTTFPVYTFGYYSVPQEPNKKARTDHRQVHPADAQIKTPAPGPSPNQNQKNPNLPHENILIKPKIHKKARTDHRRVHPADAQIKTPAHGPSPNQNKKIPISLIKTFS